MVEGEKLMGLALQARERAYCPYSHFAVGAALLCEDDSVYTGCNVESAAYTPTCCAERNAFFKAVSEGKRAFKAIAVCGGPEGEKISFQCSPCGVCRQVMAEFCGKDFEVYLTDGQRLTAYSFSQLFPLSFGPGDLNRGASGEV